MFDPGFSLKKIFDSTDSSLILQTAFSLHVEAYMNFSYVPKLHHSDDGIKTAVFFQPLNFLRAGRENRVCRIRVESVESNNFLTKNSKTLF
jgi:hypothetical protein